MRAFGARKDAGCSKGAACTFCHLCEAAGAHEGGWRVELLPWGERLSRGRGPASSGRRQATDS